MLPEETILRDTITLGGGCFWCTEAVFQRLKGVYSVKPGYSGGTVANPSYQQVCSGRTGHVEVAQVVFNPNELTLSEILEVFFKTHDPTSLNRQGNDVGTQYRSVIFYRNRQQQETAEAIVGGLDKSGAYEKPIVTTVEPLTAFYPAENYHQNYFNEHRFSNPYCQYVIIPKIEKLEHYFRDRLKR